MSDWRNDPATKAQISRLEAENISFKKGLTKGEASDLIGSTVSPDQNDAEILKFFRVDGARTMNQTQARQAISDIFSIPENQEKWENRPASKDQKDFYKFFSIPIPKGLQHGQAKVTIDETLKNNANDERWTEHLDKLSDREDWFEDTYDEIDNSRDLYDSKKIPRRLFNQVIESLEAEGLELDDITEEDIFERAFKLNENLQKAPSEVRITSQSPKSRISSRSNKKSDSFSTSTIIGFFVILGIITLFWPD